MTRPGRPWRRAAGWLALLAPLFYLSYGLANHLAAARAAHGGVGKVVFDWERHIPFWDWTIFPYWSLNAFYGLSLFLAWNRHVLDRHVARLLTAQAVAVACFIAWPLQFSFGQPPASGASALLFDALRGFDQPFNQAPSLHIALSVILWDLYRRLVQGRVARWVLHGWTLAICASVLTTWQHHFIDIPTGALLGVLCVWAWPLERRVSMLQAWRRAREPQRLRLAMAYTLGAGALGALAAGVTAHATPMGLLLLWPAVSLLVVALNYAGFGARGFQVDAQGRMAWAATLLLWPYLGAARLNGRWWTRGRPAARELLPGVWIGSVAQDLHAALPRGAAVLSLCAELPVRPPAAAAGQAPDDAARARTRCLPWLDLVPASPAALRRAARRIDAAVAGGEAVGVACALGVSRSAAALACWLARSGRARDVDDALAQVQRLHPQAVLGPAWRRALLQAVAR